MNNEEFEEYKLTNESKNIKKEKPSKHAVLLSALIILFSIVVVVLYVSTSNTRKNEKYAIPESAEEILPDIAMRITNVSDIPKIRFYAYSDNTAAELYTFAYLIGNLDIDYCTFSIYTAEDDFTKLTSEDINNAEEMTDIPLPQEWIDFYNDNDFAEGNVSLKDFVSKNIADKIEKNIDVIISDSGINELQNDEQDNQISFDDENAEAETTTNYLRTKEYELDGEKIVISLIESGEKYKILVLSHAVNEEKASLILATFITDLKKIDSLDGFDISVICNDLLVTYLTTETGYLISGTNKDGTTVLATPDWIVSDFTMSEDEINDFSNKIAEFLVDFGNSQQ